jgi:hypothetical protein
MQSGCIFLNLNQCLQTFCMQGQIYMLYNTVYIWKPEGLFLAFSDFGEIVNDASCHVSIWRKWMTYRRQSNKNNINTLTAHSSARNSFLVHHCNTAEIFPKLDSRIEIARLLWKQFYDVDSRTLMQINRKYR